MYFKVLQTNSWRKRSVRIRRRICAVLPKRNRHPSGYRFQHFAYRFLTISARMALSTASTITPTSAKIAAHILAMPSAPRIRHSTLMPMAKIDVFIDDADALPGNTDGLGDFQRVVIHEHDVRRFNCRIGAQGTHGNAHIRPGQYRCIVDAVAHEGKVLLGVPSG